MFSLLAFNTNAAISIVEWSDTSDLTKEIVQGEEATFDYASTTANPPLKIKIELIDPNNIIHILEDITLGSNLNSFGKSYTILPAHYSTLGLHSVKIHTTDNINQFQTKYLYLNILKEAPINNPPVLQAIGNKNIQETSLLVFTLTAVDTENDDLTFTSSNLPIGSTITKVNANTATFSYAPDFNTIQHPSLQKIASVTFQVEETNNPSNSDSEQITITIQDLNQAPTLNTINDITVDEGQSITITPTGTDPDGDALDFSINDNRFTKNNGDFIWQTSQGDQGIFDIIITAVDNFGSQVTTMFQIIVNAITSSNNDPQITSTPITQVQVNTLYQYNVDATDIDNDQLTYSLSVSPVGMAINSNSGLITWTPTQVETVNVLVIVNDGNNGVDSQSYTITVTEDPVTPPTPKKPKSKDTSSHNFEISNNIITKQSENYIDTYVSVRNTGTKDEKIKLSLTLAQDFNFANINVDNKETTWRVIRLDKPQQPGKYILTVKAENRFNDRDSVYRIIEIQ